MANNKGNTLVIISVVGVVAAVATTLLLMNRKAKKIDQLVIGQDSAGNNVTAIGSGTSSNGVTLPPGFVLSGYGVGMTEAIPNSDAASEGDDTSMVHSTFAFVKG